MKHLFCLSIVKLLAFAGGIFVCLCPYSIHAATSKVIPVYTYEVVSAYPHDQNAFTQGLVFENGFLYEGTGLYGRSTLRRVRLKTGEILQIRRLPDRFFGEGVTIYRNKIIQLTYRSNIGFVYGKEGFELLHKFTFPTQGWGITYDGRRLIMSDGTATLHYLDPETFEVIGGIHVRDNYGPVSKLNELEFIQGEIYANVWKTDHIARIAPQTGKVIGWINLKGLLSAEDHHAKIDVLNGIAYDAEKARLFVTGKWWPKVFEIKLISP